MAQLKDDCFAFGGELKPLADALEHLKARVAAVTGTETVALRDAMGRILAEDLMASRDVPPLDNSAVDGYAVYAGDLEAAGETRLPVTGRIAAGHPLGRPAERGQAFRIFTGAPMPVGPDGTQGTGPDIVFMEEDCTPDGDHVVLPAGLKPGANRRRAGEDIEKGGVILRAGQRLRPQDVGLAASVGCATLTVYRRLRVAVFSTGDEVREVGEDLPPGCIYDSNRYAISALLESLGCEVGDLGILPDRYEAIRDALADAAGTFDLIVTSAGVSTGEEDHVRDAVEALGAIHFWRLAIRPGRPLALGQVAGTPFIGLPGNPVAVMVTFMRFARPAILLLMGATDIAPNFFRVRAAFGYTKKRRRREWIRASLFTDTDGVLAARRFPREGAGILTSMVESDGLVELSEELTQLDPGTMVDFLPFSEVS